MFRYVALEWNPQDATAAAFAQSLKIRCRCTFPDWHTALDTEGLYVACTGRSAISTAVPLRNNSGVVLGGIFKRSQTADDAAQASALEFDSAESRRLLQTQGKHLIDSYWGPYIALLACGNSATRWIVRSPTCVLPCMWTGQSGVNVFFSRMEDCMALQVKRFSINWKFVGAYVACIQPQSGETGINEVRELHLAQCMHRRREETNFSLYWNPCAISQTDIVDDAREAAALLRRTTRACVFAWAARTNRAMLTLSGGIDSSIALSCLSAAPTRLDLTCLHHYSVGAGDDERYFARLSAERAGRALIERQRDPNVRLEELFEMPRTARPAVTFPRLERDRIEARIAREHGIDTIFSGNLGDVLFHFSPASGGAEEYLQRHGAGWRLFQTALDAAQLDRVTVWTILRNAFRDRLAARRRSYWIHPVYSGRGHRGMTRDIANAFTTDRDLTPYIHPWMKQTRGMPLGKLRQIAPLTFDYYYDVLAETGEPERPAIFFSEPLVELCLRIPTYLHTKDGWDRAMARAAFREDLAPQIARRTTKGNGDHWVRELLARNVDFIRPLLLDGVMVREKILDRRQLEAAMPGRTTRSALPVSDLIEHVCTEVWARSWMAACSQQAAA